MNCQKFHHETPRFKLRARADNVSSRSFADFCALVSIILKMICSIRRFLNAPYKAQERTKTTIRIYTISPRSQRWE